MKRILHFVTIFISFAASAQPTFIGALSSDGPQNGGSLFKLEMPASTTSVVYSFNNLAPHSPQSALTIGDDDWLYGTLRYNGSNSNGAFYRIKKDGSGFNILYQMSNFLGQTTRPYFHTDGKIYFSNETDIIQYDPATGDIASFPTNSTFVRNFLIDSDDWIYFTTSYGSLCKMKTDGSLLTTLRNFNQNPDGYNGVAGVTEAPGDSLFGVLQFGGSLNGGIIFSIKKDGNGFSVLHEFDSNPSSFDGYQPESKLVLFDGRLFGTTSAGGINSYGTVYTINLDGTGFHVVAQIPAGVNGTGSSTVGDISISSDPSIIGAFSQFSYSTNGPQRFFRVDTAGIDFEMFGYVDQHESGHANNSPLLLDDGTILFTTQTMGRHDGGAFSSVLTGGSIMSLYNFGASATGFKPGELIKASDGNLYGITTIGGAGGNGIIYSTSSNGTGYTKLYELNDLQGYDIQGKLLEASDGKLYGACGAGGPIGTGCLFRLNKDGSNFEVIYNFPSLVDGYSPTGSLVEDAGGFLYGTTLYSYSGYGVVFRINKNGSGYAVLKVFNPGDPELLYGGVKLSAGYLYGIGYFGGASGYGGVFRIHTDGTGYELLHSFDLNIDGSYPFSSAVVSNGKLYGTTTFGGSSNYGTIYSMDISGMNFTVLRDLAPGDVQSLQHGIIVSSDGALYGAGYTNTGTAIFRMNANGSNYSILKTFDVIAEGQSATSLLETNNVSLPVTLTKFQVQRKNETAWITWETAQEANSKSFEIERSGNGNEFNNIGSVNARGNSNTTTSYSFSDDSPIKGMNYYRLKQLDNDGKFSYSSIKSIAFNKESNLIVYPNPAIDKIQLRLSSAYRNATVELMNSEGRILQKFNIANVDLVQLNMNSFPAGNYILRVSTNSESETVSFIKMKE